MHFVQLDFFIVPYSQYKIVVYKKKSSRKILFQFHFVFITFAPPKSIG